MMKAVSIIVLAVISASLSLGDFITATPVLDVDSFDIAWGSGKGASPYKSYDRPNVAIHGVWQPTQEGDATYNHHCIAGDCEGTIYGLFSTGDFGEGNIGQYARYTYSTNGGASFAPPQTLIPRIDERVRTGAGWGLYPTDIVDVQGSTFAVVSARYGDGALSDSNGVMAVEISVDGSLGEPQWIINPQSTVVTNFPTASDSLITSFSNHYAQAWVQPTWQWVQDSFMGYSRPSIDGFGLAEPSSVRFGDYALQLWRDNINGDYNIVRVADGGVFSTARTSDVADTLGGSTRQIHWLKNNKLGMMGNADNSRFSLYFSEADWRGKDGSWSLNAPSAALIGIGTSSELFNARVGSKGGGTAYADFHQINTNLMMCIYSRQKEGIEIALWNRDGTTAALPYEVDNIGDLNPSRWLTSTSLSLSDGNPISTWADASTNANDVTGTATYHTGGQNGVPYVEFNGTSDFLSGSQVISGQEGRTIIFVAKADVASDGGLIALTDAATTVSNVFTITSSMTVDIGGSSIGRSTFALTTLRINTVSGWEDGYLVEPTGTNNWHEIKYRQNLAGAGLTTTVNPNAQYNTSPGNTRIGRDNSNNYFDGKIYEIIEFDRRLNRTEINQAGLILENKYNVPIWGCDATPQ